MAKYYKRKYKKEVKRKFEISIDNSSKTNKEIAFNYKKIFLFVYLGGVISANAILPLISIDEEKEKIIEIPAEFSGDYLVITGTPSTGTSYISFPIIPNFS